ncbi:hypothetical protein AB6813_11720 [bacterium RCC_150]
MNRSEDGEATRRWAEAERLAAGLPSETERSRNRRAWAFITLFVLILAAIGCAAAFLLPQNLLGDAVAVADWLKTTGYIIEAVAILLGIAIWVHATRTGQRPTRRGMVLAPLSLTQRRRIANQIKGREPVDPEEMPVVLAAAHQSLAAQRFSLRILPAYFLFTVGNLLWTDWGLAKVLFVVALIMFVAAVPFVLKSLRRTKGFLKNAGPDASKAQ